MKETKNEVSNKQKKKVETQEEGNSFREFEWKKLRGEKSEEKNRMEKRRQMNVEKRKKKEILLCYWNERWCLE